MAKRKLTPEEVKQLGIDPSSLPVEPAPGEPGQPGLDQYQVPPMTAGGAHLGTGKPQGTAWDMAKSWANEAPLGFGPQIQGAMGAVAELATHPDPTDPPHPLDAYRDVRNAAQTDLNASESTHMGSIGSAVAPFTTPLPVKALAPGASAGARAWQGAKVGAGVGGASALAHSDVDFTDLTPEGALRAAKQVGAGMGGGAVIGAPLGALSRVPAKVGEGAESGAKRLALGSLGMTTPQRGQLAATGKTDDAAQLLLDKTLGWSRGGTAERTAAELGAAGKAVGDIRAGIDTAAGGKTIDPQRIGDALRAEAARVGTSTPEARAVAEDLMRRAEMADAHGGGALISLSEAEATFKSPLNEAARKAKTAQGEVPASQQAREIARDTAAKYNEEQAERIAQLLAPDLASKYSDAKQRYAVAKELARILQKSEPEAFAKGGGALEPLDLPSIDINVGGSGDGFSGSLTAAATNLAKRASFPLAAKGLNALGGALQKAPSGGVLAGQEGERMSKSLLSRYFDSMRDEGHEPHGRRRR